MMNIHTLASGSDGNEYLITDGSSNLLIECGIGKNHLRNLLDRQGLLITDIDACLISHSHDDHAKSVRFVLGAGVDCVMGAECAEKLGVLSHHKVTVPYRIDDDRYPTIDIGRWAITPFDGVHDVPCLGFFIQHVLGNKIENAVYISDSMYTPVAFPVPVNYYIIGCNYDLDTLNDNIANGIVDPASKPRLMRSHASLSTVLDMLRENDLSKLREVHLIHGSSRNLDKEKAKREVQQVTGVPVYIY